MALFAIADLHFAFSVDKPMDIFGENWKNHSEKIIASWKKYITEEDTVLLPGDLSWGMRIDEAAADLDVIYSLPGRKILLGGNHDYWWKSSSKLEARYPGMRFLKNNFDRYADWHKFVENLISSDGGGLLAVYVGDEEFSTTCTPGTEYVIYGFAYDDLEVRSDISFFRASSLSFSSVSSPSQSNGGKSRRSPSEKRV